MYRRWRRLYRWITRHRTTSPFWKFSRKIGLACCLRSPTRCINSVCLSTWQRYRPTLIRWRIFSTSPTRREKRSKTRLGSKRFVFPFTQTYPPRMKKSLSPHIDSFLTMIAVEKGLAKNTVEAYSRDLMQLSDFLVAQGITSWKDTASANFRSYFSFMRAKGLSARSIARNVVTLRRFYRFLETEEIITENPVPSFHVTASARKLPHTLSGDDVRKLLAQPNSEEPLGVRDQAMLELLYATGLRVSELITLQMQQIDFEGNFLTVQGKGSKMRAVPFGKWAQQKLLTYI